MKTLTEELMEYGVSEQKIKRILAILQSGKIARDAGNYQIDSIFVNDEGMAEIITIDDNGNEDSIYRELN